MSSIVTTINNEIEYLLLKNEIITYSLQVATPYGYLPIVIVLDIYEKNIMSVISF